MAQEYAKVLRELSVDLTVIGRGADSARRFKAATGFSVVEGGLESFYRKDNFRNLPDNAIVAVGVEQLSTVVSSLLNCGLKKILVEKPGGLYASQIYDINSQAESCGAEVFVAYNRRFFSSVRESRKIIAADGGIQSFHFEFTEWGHEIEGLSKEPGVKENWVLANSSHVIDLAFYLGGAPKEFCSYKAGGLPWHPSAAKFSGAGLTSGGALFSYQANWQAPGRWGIELCTNKHRLILRPMEQLQIMRKGSITIEPCILGNSDVDQKFKPGLFFQTQHFLSSDNSSELCDISGHIKMLPVYEKIAGYD